MGLASNEGLGLSSAQPVAILVARFFVSARWAISLFGFKFVEQQSVDSEGLDLRYPTLPNGIEGLFQYLRLASRVDLVNKRHVFSGREDVLELFLGGLEYVIYAIDCPMNDLDVLHERLRVSGRNEP